MPTPTRPRSPAAVALRVLGAIAGGLLALVIALISFGTVIAALAGMWLAGRVQRRRGRPATRLGAWLGACIAMTVVSGAGYLYLQTTFPPDKTLSAVLDKEKATMDTMHSPELPPELERMLGGRERYERSQHISRALVGSKPLMMWSITVGLILACALYGLIFGSVLWGAVMLSARGILGVWLPRPPPAP